MNGARWLTIGGTLVSRFSLRQARPEQQLHREISRLFPENRSCGADRFGQRMALTCRTEEFPFPTLVLWM